MKILKGIQSLPRQVALFIYHSAFDILQDYRLGIHTLSLAAFHSPDRYNNHPYQPTSYLDFLGILEFLKTETAGGVFLDLGCGKGRLLALAARQPFRKIIGVDISDKLCARAERNLRRLRGTLQCQDFEVIKCDAADYEVPPEVTVIFLFNPFGAPVIARVVENIKKSLIATPRKLVIIYGHPTALAEEMERCTWLTLKKTIEGMRRHFIMEGKVNAG